MAVRMKPEVRMKIVVRMKMVMRMKLAVRMKMLTEVRMVIIAITTLMLSRMTLVAMAVITHLVRPTMVPLMVQSLAPKWTVNLKTRAAPYLVQQ